MELNKVVKTLNDLAPLNLAESWDNVGLLVEPWNISSIKKILLTNDLTEAVLQESIDEGANFVLSYHPPIFRGMKRITQCHWKDRIVSRCMQTGIAIYSPHTAHDAMQGGVNDWLVSAFGNGDVSPVTPSTVTTSSAPTDSTSIPQIGMGRISILKEKKTVLDVVSNLKEMTGLSHLRIALAVGHSMASPVEQGAVCAGSGSSVLRGVKADLIITGEMSHHDVLEFAQTGTSVILLEHSNSERGFLSAVLKPKLDQLFQNKPEIVVSKVDKDPLQII